MNRVNGKVKNYEHNEDTGTNMGYNPIVTTMKSDIQQRSWRQETVLITNDGCFELIYQEVISFTTSF